MNVAFRVDASTRIGTGHALRCLALALALRQRGHAVSMITRALPGHQNDVLRAQAQASGFSVHELPAPQNEDAADDGYGHWLGVAVAQDAAETRALCGPLNLDWLVVDHYALDAQWHRLLRGVTKRLMVIDDLANRACDCDLLLDQNLQAAGGGRYREHVGLATSLLLGPRFALQRPEFSQLRQRRDTAVSIRRVAVFFGGVDAAGLTEKVAQAIAALDKSTLQFDVYVGAANPRADAIRQCLQRVSWARVLGPSAQFASLLAQADLAVGAGGGSMWERCTLGLPSIVVSIAANQEPGCIAAAQSGSIFYLGPDAEVSGQAVLSAIELLRHTPRLVERMANACRAVTDGQGVQRVIRAMETLGTIALRRAQPDDCKSLFDWRNHPRTRAASFDTQELDWDGHCRWFNAVLSDPQRALLVAQRQGEPVGVLRLDRKGTGVYVSIYRVPGQRPDGSGTEMLRAGAEWVQANWPEVQCLEAEIRADNTHSIAAFDQAGYAMTRGVWVKQKTKQSANRR